MFTAFHDSSRDVVRRALRHARHDGAAEIGTGHLLRALLTDPEADPEIAGRAGLDAGRVRRLAQQIGQPHLAGLSEADADALAGIGIDLEAVVARAERELGPAALRSGGRRHRLRTPLSARGRAALAAAARLAAGRGDRELRPEHLLAALDAMDAMDDEQRRTG